MAFYQGVVDGDGVSSIMERGGQTQACIGDGENFAAGVFGGNLEAFMLLKYFAIRCTTSIKCYKI